MILNTWGLAAFLVGGTATWAAGMVGAVMVEACRIVTQML